LIKLARRRFDLTDQNWFAAFSGDHNPMHVDPILARRTQAASPVVHGIHLLLWALNTFAEAEPGLARMRSLRVLFRRFVFLEEDVDLVLTQREPGRVRLSLLVDNVTRSKVTLVFGDDTKRFPNWVDDTLPTVPRLEQPSVLPPEQAPGRQGRVLFCAATEQAKTNFPAAAAWLGAESVGALATSSLLVGMICPGMHSIYNELAVETCDQGDLTEALAFRVTEVDPRVNSAEMEIAGGGLTGKVYSFFRRPPVSQPAMKDLDGIVLPAEFSGSTALIVGGSRGLGELTAKLLAAGGAHVQITWQRGREDAERVAQDIRTAGGTCETLSYDAHMPVGEQLSALTAKPTHAYYFATPQIFRAQPEIYAAARLQEFLAIYVEGFWQLVQSLRVIRPELSILYPSSVFVSERPEGMTEYAMAKAAGEVLCADMNRSLAPMHVTAVRLPRLPTDQTASVQAIDTASPVEIMLPILREVQSWPR
jgi:acyl dehydratase/NAD(P)-dependent dehydrogenase (short-subunit alcohol dehydrogenase family)